MTTTLTRPRALPALEVASVRMTGSEHPYQDTWSVHGTTAWVIDGASRPGGTPGTVESYVASLSAALHDALQTKPAAPLRHILRAAITATATDTASATIAMARAAGHGFDWLVLGDALIVTSTGQIHTDQRLAGIGTALRAERSRVRQAEGPGAHYQELTRELLAVEDAHRNRVGGFWVAGSDPAAATHALCGDCADQRIALMSDGLADVPELDLSKVLGSEDLAGDIARWRSQITGPIDDITVAVLEWE